MSIQRKISTVGRTAVQAGVVALVVSAWACGSALDVPNRFGPTWSQRDGI